MAELFYRWSAIHHRAVPMSRVQLAIEWALRTHTVASLARKLRVNRNAIQRWRNGEHTPSREHLEALAAAAELPTEALEES